MLAFRFLILLTVILLVPSLASADVSEGLKAYQANDVKTAFRHWKLGADQGNPDAQYWLGRLYEEGRGVPQDFEEAHMWYNLSAAQGNEEARKARDALAGKMTREQLTEAQKRARTWRPAVSERAPAAAQTPSPQEATAALLRASEQGNADAVKMLLSAGANVNGRDAAGWTPLLRAAVGGHLAAGKILIEAGADVNAANPDGNTPLMGAALAGNKELAELLLQKGAKPDAKNQKGLSALTFAQQKGNNEVVALLRKVSEPQAGEVMRDPTTGMEFIFVKGGCFQMGDTFGDGEAGERPVHEVCVDGFYMGKYEVTVGLFKQFVTATGYRSEAEKGDGCFVFNGKEWKKDARKNWRDPGFQQDDKHPVVCVSWNDAAEFAKWIRGKLNGEYRLPMEAEWEYAARSGGKREKYSWGDGSPSGNVADESLKRRHPEYPWAIWQGYDDGYVYTAPVGTFKPNALALYDMSGNVWEWCQDWYDERYYGKSPRDNPKGPSSGQYKVLRGGSWDSGARYLRASDRDRGDPANRDASYGFRLVLSPQ